MEAKELLGSVRCIARGGSEIAAYVPLSIGAVVVGALLPGTVERINEAKQIEAKLRHADAKRMVADHISKQWERINIQSETSNREYINH